MGARHNQGERGPGERGEETEGPLTPSTEGKRRPEEESGGAFGRGRAHGAGKRGRGERARERVWGGDAGEEVRARRGEGVGGRRGEKGDGEKGVIHGRRGALGKRGRGQGGKYSTGGRERPGKKRRDLGPPFIPGGRGIESQIQEREGKRGKKRGETRE